MKKIAAVVVTYNRLPMLQQCTAALLAQTYPCDILIVDNASSDGTGEWVSGQPQLCYRNTGANLGGAGGFNFGMRWAVEAGYDYVWIMDDDCIPAAEALEKLLDADTVLGGPENYGFLSSAVLWTDGTECRMNRQKLKKSYYEHLELLDRGIVQVEQATFVSLLFPTGTIHRYGLPIREFFIWGDDIEYTRRLTVRNGVPCYLAGQSQVVHAMKTNNGSSIATDDLERIGRYSYAFRNENYLYRQEGFKGICYYLAKCGLNFLRILKYAPNHRLKRCCTLLGGMVKGAVFHPKVAYCEERT